MTVLAEAMFNQIGYVKDASGNYNPPPEPTQAAPVAASAPAAAPKTAAAAKPVTPVKATSPEVDIPEPQPMGQPVGAVDPAAVTKKKTLLGG